MKGKPHTARAWAELKAAYRRGEGSVPELAPRWGISVSIAEKRCARERWRVERKETIAAAEERAKERDVESVAGMLTRHRRIASRLLALAEKKLDQAELDPKKASGKLLDTVGILLTRAARQERLAAGIEPAKPVLAFETAGAGAILQVKRRRNPEVPEPEPAPSAKAAP